MSWELANLFKSAEPIRQARPKSHAYKSVIGGKHLRYVGHRPSEGSGGMALYRREGVLLVGEGHGDARGVEGVEAWLIPRVILGEELAARLYHDALG
jgi:hypothetical protein